MFNITCCCQLINLVLFFLIFFQVTISAIFTASFEDWTRTTNLPLNNFIVGR